MLDNPHFIHAETDIKRISRVSPCPESVRAGDQAIVILRFNLHFCISDPIRQPLSDAFCRHRFVVDDELIINILYIQHSFAFINFSYTTNLAE